MFLSSEASSIRGQHRLPAVRYQRESNVTPDTGPSTKDAPGVDRALLERMTRIEPATSTRVPSEVVQALLDATSSGRVTGGKERADQQLMTDGIPLADAYKAAGQRDRLVVSLGGLVAQLVQSWAERSGELRSEFLAHWNDPVVVAIVAEELSADQFDDRLVLVGGQRRIEVGRDLGAIERDGVAACAKRCARSISAASITALRSSTRSSTCGTLPHS